MEEAPVRGQNDEYHADSNMRGGSAGAGDRQQEGGRLALGHGSQTVALCVPSRSEESHAATYPDFLFLRLESVSLVVDIIEPHSISLADAPAKAAGPAKFAAMHFSKFGRD